MASLSERLARLEKSRAAPTSTAFADAFRRCFDGTADVADITLLLEDRPSLLLAEELLPAVPLAIALKNAGIPLAGVLVAAPYHPDEALPADVQSELRRLRNLANEQPRDAPQRLEVWRSQSGQRSARVRAITELLAAGGRDAGHLRTTAWVRTGSGWQISAAVRAAASRRGLSYFGLKDFPHELGKNIGRYMDEERVPYMAGTGRWSYAQIAAVVAAGDCFRSEGDQIRSDPVRDLHEDVQ